jgi:hypothetical protein
MHITAVLTYYFNINLITIINVNTGKIIAFPCRRKVLHEQKNIKNKVHYYYYFFISWVGFFGTAATTVLLYQPQMIVDGDCGNIGGKKIGRGNRSTRRIPAPAPLCPPQILHD